MAVDVGLRVRTDQMRAALEQLPGIGRRESRKMATAINREWKRVPAAAKRAARQSRQQMQTITQGIGSISPAAARASAAVETLGRALGPQMAAAAGPIGMVVASLAAVGAAGFMAAGKMSSFVDEIGNLAESTGVSQRMILALRSEVRASGGDLSKTQQALQQFTKNMDLTGKSAEEVDAALVKTIQDLERIESPAERAAERMRIFGTRSAAAVAVLSGDALQRGLENTRDIATAVDEAAGASAAWDRATGELSDRWELFTTRAGTVWAESILGIADAISRADTATDSWAGSILAATPQYAVFSAALGNTDPLDEWVAWVTRSNAALRDGADAWSEYHVRAGRGPVLDQDDLLDFEQIAEFGAKQAEILENERMAREEQLATAARAAAIERAREDARRVAEARAHVEVATRREAFRAELDEHTARAEQIAEGERMLTAILEEEAEARADAARRQAEAAQALAEQQARQREAAIQGLGQLTAATLQASGLVETAQLSQALWYQATATARAFAELGPVAGAVSAAGMAVTIGDAIARASRSSGGSSGAGGQPARAPSGPARGFASTDRGASVQVIEYRGEVYDAQTRDAARRPGSPLRDIARQRRVAR